MKKKVRLKKTVKRKFLLFVILAVIMTGLIVGELTIGQREVKDPAVERLEAKISETTTQEEPQEETDAPLEEADKIILNEDDTQDVDE